MSPPDQHDPRVYLAAERTFLAWVRTGLALMGFGFIAARFAVIVELRPPSAMAGEGGMDATFPLGVVLVVAGVVVNIYAGWRYRRNLLALDRDEFRSAFGVIFACLLAGALALVGLILSVHLILF